MKKLFYLYQSSTRLLKQFLSVRVSYYRTFINKFYCLLRQRLFFFTKQTNLFFQKIMNERALIFSRAANAIVEC